MTGILSQITRHANEQIMSLSTRSKQVQVTVNDSTMIQITEAASKDTKTVIHIYPERKTPN